MFGLVCARFIYFVKAFCYEETEKKMRRGRICEFVGTPSFWNGLFSFALQERERETREISQLHLRNKYMSVYKRLACNLARILVRNSYTLTHTSINRCTYTCCVMQKVHQKYSALIWFVEKMSEYFSKYI